jgi:hypothetical protein
MTSKSEELSNLLDMIQERQKERRKLLESGMPRVGIIYVIDHSMVDSGSTEEKDYYISPTPIQEAPAYGNYKIHERVDHYDYWEDVLQPFLAKKHPVYKKLDYDFFPRGWVVYDTEEDVYLLYLDKCIQKDWEMVSKIIQDMALPRPKVKVVADEHYQCKGCNKAYVT